MSGDILAILRAWLAAQAGLTAVVGQRIYTPRLPEGATLPALGFFARGGSANPHIAPLVEPSIQFDCWGGSPIEARSVYKALYDVLQGIDETTIVIGVDTYRILGAVEEVQGQDIQDVQYSGYHRVLAFFKLAIQIEEV